MKNVMYFENGIKHEFTENEMIVIKTAIKNQIEINKSSQENIEELENLKSLFLEHLD